MNVHVIRCHLARADALFSFCFTRFLRQTIYLINYVDKTDYFNKYKFAIQYFR